MDTYNIDDIMRKDPTERTPDEIEFMIEWKSEQRFKEKEFLRQAKLDAEMRHELLEYERESVRAGLESLQEMSAKAMEAYERASNGQASA